MALDMLLLQSLKHRKNFTKLHKVINARALDSITATLVEDFRVWFAEQPECKLIPVDGAFQSWFVTVRHRKLSAEDAAVYRKVLSQIKTDPPEAESQLIIGKLMEANAHQLIADLVERWDRGEEFNLIKALESVVTDYHADFKRKVQLPEVLASDSLFDDDLNDTGFSWGLAPLAASVRKLREGDFVIIAGRPDKGKTSFVADLVTAMAKDMDIVYPDEQREIVWLLNEGPGPRTLKRVMQVAMGAKVSELVRWQQEGTLFSRFSEALGFDHKRLRIMCIHGWKSWQVEELLKQCNVGLLVIDMIDNIRFDGDVANGGQRTDQLLEAMYQWGRDLGIIHGFPVIATSQISADGDGMAFPTLPMLKDSKTGKQGAADVIITLGAKNEPAYTNLRFIGCTKNKLRIDGSPGDPRATVCFDSAVGKFYAETVKEAAPTTEDTTDAE